MEKGAIFRLVAEFQRQAASVPLALSRMSDAEEQRLGAQLVSRHGVARTGSMSGSDQELESDLARTASDEQHPTFPTREFDDEMCGDLDRIAGPSSCTGCRGRKIEAVEKPEGALLRWFVPSGGPKGIRMVVGHELTFEVSGIAVRP